MKDYRKIYERHYECSLLPGIDIHHKDGNHGNNHPSNLQPVTLEEHYLIHKSQKDYYAAYLIGRRMKIKPEDWEQMARENGRKSAVQNRDNGVGLIAWAKNNPELAQHIRSENGKKSGRKCVEEKLGIHGATSEQRKEWSSKAGKASPGFKLGHASVAGKLGGKKGGAYAKENRTGIFSLSPEKNKERHLNSVISKLIKNGKMCAWPPKA
jgi:HNH endonuclease